MSSKLPGIAGPSERTARTAGRVPALLILSGILLCSSEAGAQKAQFIGAQACGACHPAQLKSQSESAHSKSLYPAGEHPLATSFAPEKQFVRRPNFQFQLSANRAAIRVRASDNKDAMDIPMEWAFGAGKQAVTFVTRVNQDWYLEHYLSYYSALGSFAPTPGQAAVVAHTLPEAMGILYKTADPAAGILKCFECHSTGPVSYGSERDLQPTELGVRCEACHGAGSLHRAAVLSGNIEKARQLIQNPKRMSPPDLIRFCGNCHRQPGPAVSTDWNVPWNLRHQPIYLSQSACFRKSGALSCLTCHDPHEKLQNDDAAYNMRCRECHTAESHAPKPVCLAKPSASCAGCHMPKVSPQSYLRFTNHWIGVYSDNAKLKPVR